MPNLYCDCLAYWGDYLRGDTGPTTLWFQAGWEFSINKGGISATTLKSRLELNSYQTAWSMLHKYRRAMALAGREKLSGIVEVDETAIGGKKSGKPGRGAAGETRVAIAIELKDPQGFGRVRLRVIPDYTAKSLGAFLKETVEEGSTIVTDDWKSYPPATRGKYTHIAHNQSTSTLKPHELLPGVHRVASLLKRWILGTLQGSVSPEHVPSYLDEFTFRFNRPNSEARGMLFFRLMALAAIAGPVTYKELTKAGSTGNPFPAPPRGTHRSPPSLAARDPSRPWRTL